MLTVGLLHAPVLGEPDSGLAVLGRCLVDAWQMPGGCLADAWQIPDSVPGRCLG